MKKSDLVFMLLILLAGFWCFMMKKDGWGMGCFLGTCIINIWYIEENKKED